MTHAGGSGAWAVLGLRRLTEALEAEPDDVRREVLAAFVAFAEDPPDDPGTVRLRGMAASRYPDTRILRLPHDWTVTYELFPQGLPPLAGPILLIRAVVRIWPFEPEPVDGQP